MKLRTRTLKKLKTEENENETDEPVVVNKNNKWRCKRSFFEKPTCDIEFEENMLQYTGYDTQQKCKTNCKPFVTASKTNPDDEILSSIIDSTLSKLHSDDYDTSILAVQNIVPITIKNIPNRPGIEFTLDSLINPSDRLRNFINRETRVFNFVNMHQFSTQDSPSSLMPIYDIAKDNGWIEGSMSFDNFYNDIYIPFIEKNNFSSQLDSFEKPWSDREWRRYVKPEN